MRTVERKLVKCLCENGYIPQYDEEIMVYGMQHIMRMSMTIFFCMLLGILTDNLFNTVIYMCFFITLRKQCGGYHATKRIVCFFLFIFFLLITIIGNTLFLKQHKLMVVIAASWICFKLSQSVPCGTIQNPIPNKIKKNMQIKLKNYCQRGQILLLLGVGIDITWTYFASCGIIICGVLYGAGKWKIDEKVYNK